MLKWAVGQRRSEASCLGPPPKRTRRCSSGKENTNEWEAGSRESIFSRFEPSALRDVSNYQRLGDTPPRTPEQLSRRRISLKRSRMSEERVLEWVGESPDRKRPQTTASRLSHDPVRSLLQIEFSPILPLNSPSPVELDHKEIPLGPQEKEAILQTPRLRDGIARRLMADRTVSPLALRLNYLELGGKVLESPATWMQPPVEEEEICERLRTPPSGSVVDSLAFLESVRMPEPISNFRRMKSVRRPRRRHPISSLTLPDGVPSPFESPAVMARLRAPPASMLTLPEGIPSPASPALHLLSDTSTTSSNKIFDEDDAVSNLGSAEQSPCPVVEGKSRSRRCLTFTSPVRKRLHRTPSGRQQGELELSMHYESPELSIQVIRGKNLHPPSGSGACNAYIKVSLVPAGGNERAFHRTCVRKDSSNPRFDSKFTLPLTEDDLARRVLVSAWHRDRSNRKSEFLGCMSFAVKHVIKRDISGSFRLLSQSCGRIKNVPTMTNSDNIWHQHTDVMANQSESSVEELLSVDESDVGPPHDTPGVRDRRKVKSCKKDIERVHEDQIFLRHLELDPPEEETTHKSGRTPFTTTRTLCRQPGSSFGFSIAWTHPPRVERVEAGLPADQAGLRPGDYVIFVGKTNVVTLQEEEILQIIKSYGDRVVLEVYRKVTTNGTRSSTALLNQPRPSTACSGATTATSIDRRRLHLPQVTFTTEVGSGVIV